MTPPSATPKPLPPAPLRPVPPSAHADNGSAANGTPESGATPAGAFIVPAGKYRGQTLDHLTQNEDGCGSLFFLAHKRAATTDADKALTAAAQAVLQAKVAAAVEEAVQAPDKAMPVLPFGDDKGKRLDQAHPKWAAFLAKKQESDARSYADLVLYGVAKRLAAARGGAGGYARGGGLTAEQFGQLLGVLQTISAALEKLAARP
jgi:hypothetical protein